MSCSHMRARSVRKPQAQFDWHAVLCFAANDLCRIQAKVGNLLSAIIPRQQLVPAVQPENLHPDPAVVSFAPGALPKHDSKPLFHDALHTVQVDLHTPIKPSLQR